MKFSCILLAAGRGLRARSAANKVLVRAGDIPILYYSLKRYAALQECAEIVLVANQEDIKQGLFDKKQLTEKYRVSKVVEGGERRTDSVRHGFEAASPQVPLVAVHDAARPFISEQTILAVVREAQQHGAAMAAVPVGDTLKAGNLEMFVTRTLPRRGVFLAQTPQVFKRELLERAYAQVDTATATDDAQLIELLGEKIKLVESKTTNLKITTPEDLVMAIKLLPVWEAERG